MKSNLIFGIHPVSEAIKASRELDKVLIQKGATQNRLKEIFNDCHQLGIPIQLVPVEKLNRTTKKNHQGVIAFISAIHYKSFENIIDDTFSKGKDPLILMLDRVTDVRNFGAISRTAEGMGYDAIITPYLGSAQINEDAIKTSAGALHHIPVSRVKDLRQTVQYLKDSGFRIVAAMEKADKQLFQTELTGPVVLIMGSEENGIDEGLLKMVHKKVRIPMYGKIESYNVSVSFAIISYEIIRQRSA